MGALATVVLNELTRIQVNVCVVHSYLCVYACMYMYVCTYSMCAHIFLFILLHSMYTIVLGAQKAWPISCAS